MIIFHFRFQKQTTLFVSMWPLPTFVHRIKSNCRDFILKLEYFTRRWVNFLTEWRLTWSTLFLDFQNIYFFLPYSNGVQIYSRNLLYNLTVLWVGGWSSSYHGAKKKIPGYCLSCSVSVCLCCGMFIQRYLFIVISRPPLQGKLKTLEIVRCFCFIFHVCIFYCISGEVLDATTPGSVYFISAVRFLDPMFALSSCLSKYHNIYICGFPTKGIEAEKGENMLKPSQGERWPRGEQTQWVCVYWTLSWPRWPSDPFASWKQWWLL